MFAEADGIGTFAERVRSWFHDGTTVTVESAAQSDVRLAPAAQPGVATISIILLSIERALVTFSMRTESSGERHLVRDVRLRNALDELGLERLASVIQSTVAAMREGLEGSDLERLKTELRSAGVDLHEAPTAPGSTDSEPDVPTPAATVAPPRRLEPRPSPARVPEARETGSSRMERLGRSSGPGFEVSYSARYGGEQALFHGPGLGFGWPFGFEAGALWLVLRAGAVFPASVGASPIRLSLQTSSARAGVAFERRSRTSVSEYAALLAGVDIARVSPRLQADTSDEAKRYTASRSTTKFWGEVGLVAGIWYRGAFDVGIFGTVDYCLTDVRYVIESASADRSVLSPWRLQPGLFVSGRFGVTRLD